MTQPDGRTGLVGFRRRPTRRHRRNQFIRRASLISTLAVLIVAVSVVALSYLSPSLFHAQRGPVPTPQQSEASRQHLLLTNQQAMRPAIEGRLVYPYSVIPGGVQDIRELKFIAEHDPVVASHYSGFDYDHARIVRLVLAQTAYVSYRIGNHIYWTRHRLALHKGEKLITDGRKTIRARCGNRVETLPQQATSSVEPSPEKFDQPIRSGAGTATNTAPVPYRSALMNRPPVMGAEPSMPLSLYDPMEGGYLVPLSVPPIPAPVCSPVKTKGGGSSGTTGGKGKKGTACGPGTPETVPEPGTWLLVASGLGLIFWQFRRGRRPELG